MTGEVTFTITEAMIDRFMDLTGDRSSLHADQAFAERSMYRRRIVHGMLPIAFLTALPLDGAGSRPWVLSKLSGRFLKPVFPGDRLLLTATAGAGREDANTREVECVFKHAGSGAVVTTVNALLRGPAPDELEQAGARKRPRGRGATLLLDAISEQAFRFDELAKGQKADVRFAVADSHIEAWHNLVAQGLAGDTSKPPIYQTVHPANVMAVCLVSTLAGMCLPGKHATLMEFSVAFASPIRLGTAYRLAALIEHKSPSTGILSEALSIYGLDDRKDPCASGTVRVKVNEAEVKGPSMAALRQEESDLQLKDKIVLITGASRGIGATTAKLFAVHGAKVAVNYHKGQEEAKRIVGEIKESGGDAFAVRADVSDREQVRYMVEEVRRVYGPVQVLVNNAVANAYPVSFQELTWDSMQQDLDVVLKGAFNCCQEALPAMVENRWGRIVNLSTIFTDNPPTGQTKYVTSKSALTGLTRSLAKEMAVFNIQVNMVVASIVETDLSKHVPKMFLSGMKNDTPMKRHATTGDVAKAIVFLASSLASFTTGQRIMVTGGNPPFL
jgi:3-oxoacyl-[acyl-carrier protein] reductase